MRVMMIAPYPRRADRIDGGVSAASMYLSQALASRGDVELIGVRIARDGKDLPEGWELGWPVVDLPLGRLSLSTLFMPQRRRLRELVRHYDPDVVHAQGADLSGYLAVRCGRAAVVTAHGLLAECARLQSDPVNRLRASVSAAVTERSTIRRATDLIAISPYVAQHYRGDIRGRVHEVPNAIGSAFFDVSRRPERGRLLYAGRIANGKGLDELIRAVAYNRYSVAKLVLAGSTPDPAYGDKLREEVSALDLAARVQFAGLLSETQLLDEFARAEALVLPSHQETAPMVVQQAMAAALPVIASNVGGIPLQIRHDVTGLMFEAGDERALSRLLARLAEDANVGKRLGDAAKRDATARYGAAAVAESTVSVYRTALDPLAMAGNIARTA